MSFAKPLAKVGLFGLPGLLLSRGKKKEVTNNYNGQNKGSASLVTEGMPPPNSLIGSTRGGY